VTERPLGRTGLKVSALSLGTAALGLDYGIHPSGGHQPCSDGDAVALIRTALDRGITLIDTAPAYGRAERLVGAAVGRDRRAIVSTKVTADLRGAPQVVRSVESSLRALDRDAVDILQIHNATADLIENGAMTRALVDLKRRGLVRVAGATVYDVDAALAVVNSGEYGVLQVAFSVLDQRMMRDVMPQASAAGIGIVVRSAYLKGVLTPKAAWLPEALAPLRQAAARVRDELAGGAWGELPNAALRFCLSAPHVSSVLAGVATLAELETALAAEAEGPLDAGAVARAADLAIEDDELLNPSRWPSVP